MPSEHSSKQYDIDLESIRSRVFIMGGMVEQQFNDAMQAFKLGDAGLAESVIRADDNVNRLEISLDDACSHLIVKRQPAAVDLRLVMATVKVITDLERIGDEASKIARMAKTVAERGVLNASGLSTVSTINHHEIVRVISSRAKLMLHDALDAFARVEGAQARAVIAQDELIDHEFRSIMRNTVTFMMEDPRTISVALDTLWVAKAIERIGDHAKNIAEYVIYVAEGKDIRHSSSSAELR